MDPNKTLLEIQKQNHFVFKRLFDQVYGDLVHYANGYLFDREASEDIVQEVFIHIWEKANSIEIKSSLKAYLYAMVRNRCLNFLKSLKITDQCNVLEINTVLINDYDLEPFPEEDKKIVYEQVLRIVDTFPYKMQLIFKMKFIENYKYTEIADELGISVNTVKTQLKRAKFKIGQMISTILILLASHN